MPLDDIGKWMEAVPDLDPTSIFHMAADALTVAGMHIWIL